MTIYNIAQTLPDRAAQDPFRPAIIFPAGRDKSGLPRFTQLNFQQLNTLVDQYARGLHDYGIHQGTRVLLLVRPGVELIGLTFALVKLGAVPVVIDPGMPTRAFLQCVREAAPTAFIGIPIAHVLRLAFRGAFKSVTHPVTVGRRWFWGGPTLETLRSASPDPFPTTSLEPESETAVVFTSGSTGTPKGVVYRQGMFHAQLALFESEFDIEPGEVDLPGLYIFALFNPALGVTTVFPDMDPTKPAEMDPATLVEFIQTFGVTNSFGSPVIWQRVACYCLKHGITLPSIRRILMAGAPVPPALIADCAQIFTHGEVYTPYGATEALPLTMISGSEILAETAARSEQGHGMCVGRPTPGTTIRIIRITDAPITEWDESLVLPQGEVGEVAVRGAVVTREYLNRPEKTARAKIRQGDAIWHRMGDLGYFDAEGRLWFCGRKDHRIETAKGLVLPDPCEAIFNLEPRVYRTALVGVGERGAQRPVLVVEPQPKHFPHTAAARKALTRALLERGAEHAATRAIREVLYYPRGFPVDVR
ncbi:MAG TPA: peptide synthase, partial [Chloroflexi bacterium]|nr:peptide synthase [Chloroflexota bacterium]